MINPNDLLAKPVNPVLAYTVKCSSGRHYAIYRPAALGNPPDYRPDKWYFGPYPVMPGIVAGEPFDTIADAERAALLMDALSHLA